MARYLLERIFQSAVVLLVMSFVLFILMGLMPGDPIDLMISADPALTPSDGARLRTLYGLDTPLLERYWNWLTSILGGNLGFSRLYSKPVLTVILPALWNTILILGLSFAISILISIPAGIVVAIRQYSRTDYIINLIAFIAISIPSFWLAIILITVFSVILGILPAGGMETIGVDSIWDKLKYLVLPVATLALLGLGAQVRFTRSEMIQTLRQEFILTARAKGAKELRVVLKHALRNAMIPVTTIIALEFGFLFSGALTVEIVFAYPGMGKLIFDAIIGNDFNLAMIALLLATCMTLAGNFFADIAYAWLDPRISY